MIPTALLTRHSSRLIKALLSQASTFLQDGYRRDLLQNRSEESQFARRGAKYIAFACLIPILVLLSGVFAGLTLGYMSLDETQLNVLSISGTELVISYPPLTSSDYATATRQQRLYANKIKPIRKNGHLLLVTLLLANMIVNESLPVIADPILGGGIQSVVVSTVLIVMYVIRNLCMSFVFNNGAIRFAEIIPQSVFTRHGLYLGAKMAGPTKVLIYILVCS